MEHSILQNQQNVSVDMAAEFCGAWKKAGGTPQELIALTTDGERLQRIVSLIRGFATLTSLEHIVDCDADPVVPEGRSIEEHRKAGQYSLSKSRPVLYLSEDQQNGGVIQGHKLRKELNGLVLRVPANANVLDHYLLHSEIIPEEWKHYRSLLFWGTIYAAPTELVSRGWMHKAKNFLEKKFPRLAAPLSVRCLYWKDERWQWGFVWLQSDLGKDRPAVCLDLIV